jgi:hypothetical protein
MFFEAFLFPSELLCFVKQYNIGNSIQTSSIQANITTSIVIVWDFKHLKYTEIIEQNHKGVHNLQ